MGTQSHGIFILSGTLGTEATRFAPLCGRSTASATTQQFARSWRQPGASESHRDAMNSFRSELPCASTKAGSAFRRGPKRPPETAIEEKCSTAVEEHLEKSRECAILRLERRWCSRFI